MVVFIKCAVCCYTVAPRVNFSEEIIQYFELELEVARTQPCANYVQHIERSSRATCRVPGGSQFY